MERQKKREKFASFVVINEIHCSRNAVTFEI